MAQYPVTKNPEELEAWKTMMDSMIKFISASTKLMNTINEGALQGPPQDEEPPKPPCEVECLICGPTRSPTICQKCAALPAIAAAPASLKPAAVAAPPPPKVPTISTTPPDDEPTAEDAPPKESLAEETPAEEPPAEEPPADEAPPEEEPPSEEQVAEEAPPREPPAEEAPAEETSPQEAPPPEEPSVLLEETQYSDPPVAATPVQRAASQPISATGGGPGAANCCCEEIKGLKAAARSLGVLPPGEGGEGGRPPCVCSKDEAPTPPPTPTKGCCICSKKGASDTTPSAKSCCCQEQKQGAQETKDAEEPGKACCCAEKREEKEKNKSARAGGPCGCGQSQHEGKPCGCGSNLNPPEPPLKLCACPPGDDEKAKLAAELIEKVDKAESEIQQLRQELQRLQYFQAAAKTPAATMYKEIMKDIYAGKCNPKKAPVLAPVAKLKRPGEPTAPAAAGGPEPATRSQSRSVARKGAPAGKGVGCSPTCTSAGGTTPQYTPAPADLPKIVTSYSRSVDRTVMPAGAEGCSPCCPAATSTPKPGSDPRRGPMSPYPTKTGIPGSRMRSLPQQTDFSVATSGSTPFPSQQGYGIPPLTQWQNQPSGNVTICTPSGDPDSMPMSDCEQYGCMTETEEQPDEDYCTDYNCDNEDCSLRPKEDKKETGDEEKETKHTDSTSSKTPSKASVTDKSASKTSKTSAEKEEEGGAATEEAPAEGGEAEAPAEGGEEAPAEEE